MNISIDVSINLNNHSPYLIEQFFKNILTNFKIRYYEDYEFDNINRYQRNHKLYTFIASHDNDYNSLQFELWQFIYKLKRKRGINIESVFDNYKNKLLFSSSYYRNYLCYDGTRKRTRSYSEYDSDILKDFFKINN